jgi:hypothetical protein
VASLPSFAADLADTIRTTPLFLRTWGDFRRREFHAAYERRRERYARLAAEQGLVYREDEVRGKVADRLAGRGYRAHPRRRGELHTLAFVPNLGWHNHLLPDLQTLGPLSVFDYVALGFNWTEFARSDRNAIAKRQRMNELFLDFVRRAHAQHPVDWIFVYASGLEVSRVTLKKIAETVGVPLVNMCLDDKNSWEGRWMGDHRAGQVDIASSFDLCWTSARVVCEWYLVEGAIPLYLPEGFNAQVYRRLDLPHDIGLSFVGTAYGFRPRVISYLRDHAVDLRVFGKGWPGARFAPDPVEIFNRSRINLGIGETTYSDSITNVKGRDFEIPATGGGVYLTSFNSDLAQHFVVGKEILCYRGLDDLLEQVRYYLVRTEETEQMAALARTRCLQEHRWIHRYERICEVLGVLERQSRESAEYGRESSEA